MIVYWKNNCEILCINITVRLENLSTMENVLKFSLASLTVTVSCCIDLQLIKLVTD